MADPRARLLITADDRASAALRKIRGEASSIGNVFSKLNITLGGLVGGGALTLFAKNSIESADNIAKLSTRLGASTEALSQYQFVAKQTGVSFDTLTTALQRSTRRISEAAQGTGEAKNALAELGLDVQRLNQLAPEQQFEVLADAIQSVENPADRVRIAVKLFDTEGAKLLQTMEGGSEAIRALRNEADQLGLTLDNDAARAAERVSDAFGRIGASAKSVAVQFVNQFGPSIESVATFLADGIPKAAQIAVNAFQDLQAFIASTSSSIVNRVGDLYGGLARAADFFDAEILARALRRTEQDARGVADTFEAVAVRVGNAKDIIFEPPKLGTARADYADIFTGGGAATGGRSMASKAAKDADNFAKALQQLEAQLDPAAAKTREYLESVALLDEAWARGLISGQRYDELFETLASDADMLADAQKKLAEDEQRAFELIKSLDPGSIYRDQITEVQRLRDTFPELSEALAEVEFDLQDKLGDTIEEVADKGEEAADQIGKAWASLGPVFSSAFEDALVEGEKLSDVLDALEKDIIRILARKLITEPLGNAITGSLPGGNNAGFFGNLLPFAAGGSFKVSGNGGTDSQVVAFRATPGERVDVSRPGATTSNNMTNNFSFVLPADTIDNRRAGQQIAREAARYMALSQAAT